MNLRVLSLGAGVQSTTMALLAAHGEIDMPDVALFADTGWEPRAVYEHLEWLRSGNVLPFPVRVVSAGNIREGILSRRNTTGGRYAAVPWHLRHEDGTAGMGRRQCTSEYKLGPLMHGIRDLLGVGPRDRIPAGAVEVVIGISTDEASRMKPARQRYMKNRWPLIELRMSRGDCLAWLEARGYPRPPKSACIGCPFRSDAEWMAMRDDSPEDWTDAVEVDRRMRPGDGRGMRAEEYMHRSLVPLGEVQFSLDRQTSLWPNECEGMCGI